MPLMILAVRLRYMVGVSRTNLHAARPLVFKMRALLLLQDVHFEPPFKHPLDSFLSSMRGTCRNLNVTTAH